MTRQSKSEDGDLLNSRGSSVSKRAKEELASLRLRTATAPIARIVWERLLTPAERERLGGDLADCWSRLGTAGMWVQARGVSVQQAIVEVAESANLITRTTAVWLLQEFGIHGPKSVSTIRPNWEKAKGELRWGKQVIRKLRVMQYPTNIQKIVDAFQEAGWPPSIRNPLRRQPEDLRQTLYSLNQGLKVIRFGSQQGGNSVTWKPL